MARGWPWVRVFESARDPAKLPSRASRADPRGGAHGVHRIEWTHRGRDEQDDRGRGHDRPLPRRRRGGAGALPALLRPRHDGLDHLLQGHRRAVAALPMHPHGPAQLQQDGTDRLPRGRPRGPGPDRRRPHGCAGYRAGALRRQLPGRAIVDGRGHHVPGPYHQVRDGRLAHRHGRRPVPDGQSALGGQPRHAGGARRSDPREHPPVSARAHRRREPWSATSWWTMSTGRIRGRRRSTRRAGSR